MNFEFLVLNFIFWTRITTDMDRLCFFFSPKAIQLIFLIRVDLCSSVSLYSFFAEGIYKHIS